LPINHSTDSKWAMLLLLIMLIALILVGQKYKSEQEDNPILSESIIPTIVINKNSGQEFYIIYMNNADFLGLQNLTQIRMMCNCKDCYNCTTRFDFK